MHTLNGIRSTLALMVEKPAPYLVPTWLLMQFIVYQIFGIQVVYDSKRYFAYAASMAEGTPYWFQPDSILYSSYTLFLYLFLDICLLPVSGIIVLQTIIAGFAVLCLYKLVLNLTANKTTAFLSVILFILWPDIHSWNFYIHTESLYTSITLFILYIITERGLTVYKVTALLLLLIFALFLRPNGFFLLIGTIGSAVFTISRTFKFEHYKSSLLICVVSALVLIYILKEALEIFSPLNYLLQGQIIQGYAPLNILIKADKVNQTSSVIAQIIHIIATQPLAYLKLSLLRILFFWGQIRPYYSTIHNIFILIYFLPIYTLALLAFRRVKYMHKAFIFMIIVASLQTLMAMVISVDWDNRFIMPILSFAFIFASIGLTFLLSSSNVSEDC